MLVIKTDYIERIKLAVMQCCLFCKFTLIAPQLYIEICSAKFTHSLFRIQFVLKYCNKYSKKNIAINSSKLNQDICDAACKL